MRTRKNRLLHSAICDILSPLFTTFDVQPFYKKIIMATKYRVAAQMFGFRDYLKTPEDILKTLKRVKKMGYDYVQLSGFPGDIDMADVKALCDKAKVTPIGAHISLPQFRENTQKVIDDCKKLGISYVAIPWLNASEIKTLADWKKLFKEFEGYATAFAKQGIHVQYHNHDFEFEKFGIKCGKGGTTILDMLYENTKVLQAELDLGWCARGGYNPVNWVNKVAKRMDQVHFKDWGIFNRKPEFRAVGEGSIDWPAIIKACKKTGVKDFIVEQDSWIATGNPFVEYKISREYLAGLGL